MHGLVLLGVWLSSVLLVASWMLLNPRLDWTQLLCLASVAASGAAAWASWSATPEGQIAWDGTQWRWESAAYLSGVDEQDVLVLADFQQVLLLKIQNQDGASRWLWAERKRMPERWLDLRRALYSPHREYVPAEPGRPSVAASGDT